jgi:hypothetical protein
MRILMNKSFAEGSNGYGLRLLVAESLNHVAKAW